MGEYYNWVNVDRKEYICPNDFGLGNKKLESMGRGNAFLCALRELLSKEWAGDHILFMGDEKPVPADPGNDTLRILYGHIVQAGYPEDASDTVIETHKNVSGLFKAAEAEVRQEILRVLKDLENNEPTVHNEYGVNISNPFEGLFLRSGKDFRYTINHTKRVCYSFTETRFLYLNLTENDFADPLPILMGYGQESETGAWVGDIVGVGDGIPAGYDLLKEIFLDW